MPSLGMNLDVASNDWWINDVTHCGTVVTIALKLLITGNYAKNANEKIFNIIFIDWLNTLTHYFPLFDCVI